LYLVPPVGRERMSSHRHQIDPECRANGLNVMFDELADDEPS
jgi:hypothetical protein